MDWLSIRGDYKSASFCGTWMKEVPRAASTKTF